MPYVGVGSVLRAAGLLKERENFVSILGVETIRDLTDLTEGDLIKIGVGDKWPTFKSSLATFVAKGHANSRFAGRRNKASSAILAANASASIGLFLAAAGATLYRDRLEALGVSTPADLRLLRRSDLSELGMQVLHARRFLNAARLAPTTDDATIASNAHYNATSLCSSLLEPLGLSPYCKPLALRLSVQQVEQVPLAALCSLSTYDLEVAGLRLVQRRRLRAAARTVCPSTSTSVADDATNTAGSLQPLHSWLAPKSAAAAGSLLDGCRHVFLDVGANVGINHHHLFRWNAPHHQYRHGAMQSLFDRYFGHTKAARRASVCSVGIEANPNHAPPLEQLGRMLRRHGMRAHFLTETAAATAEGTVSFNLQNSTKSNRAVHEWGASVFRSAILKGEHIRVTVRAIDLAKWVREVVLNRRVPPLPPKVPLTAEEEEAEGMSMPSVVMKMDIEGSEVCVSTLLPFCFACISDSLTLRSLVS